MKTLALLLFLLPLPAWSAASSAVTILNPGTGGGSGGSGDGAILDGTVATRKATVVAGSTAPTGGSTALVIQPRDVFSVNLGTIGTAATETTVSGIKTGTDRIPTSPAQEHTTAGSPNACRLSDGSSFLSSLGVTVGNFPATQTVSGTVTSNDGGTKITAASMPAGGSGLMGWISAVWYQLTQTLTVSVSNFPATQAVSGSVGITGTPNVAVTSTVLATGAAQDRTTAATPFACRASDGSAFFDPRLVTVQNAALAVTKSGTWALDASSNLIGKVDIDQTTPGTTNKVSIGTDGSVTLAALAAASNSPTSVISLGNSLGKTNVMKTGTLASSATTADQVILTYTVTAGKTFYLTYFACNGRLTTFAATATYFGDCSIESPAGTKLVTTMLAGSGIGDRDWLSFTEPVPIAAGVVIRVVTTPTAVTAMTWRANLGGYEK